jgi:hypothetical protein
MSNSTPDPIVRSVPISLEGKEKRLVFDFNAQAAFEKVAGVSVFDKKCMRTSSKIVRALLWAELLHHDEQVQFDEFGEIVVPPEHSMMAVGRMITRKNLKEVNEKVFLAFNLFFKREEDPAADPRPAGEKEG